MPRRTSTTVYLDADQLERLRALSARSRVPIAAIVREGVELALVRLGMPRAPVGPPEEPEVPLELEPLG